MAGQPPFSPWMGGDYYEPQFETPRDENGGRDLCWLKGESSADIMWKDIPDFDIRMINHWDNFDGTVERGYSGRSIFFEDGKFRGDLKLIEEYASLLGSIRINAVSINNVNVREDARWFITNEKGHLSEIKKIADIFEKHGIKTYIAINFAAPRIVGGLDTSDPLDAGVVEFWNKCGEEIYSVIPNFGGFVVKADAEGEPGPLKYGRTHADGANMLANAIGKFGGLVFWRCFVYNHKQDWRDRKTDRAMAAFENFASLDGQFADNVILQIKEGPIDFQVKEPPSSLFGALAHTNVAIEHQITQEYLGQQRDLCFTAPLWSETLQHNTFEPTLTAKNGAASVSATIRELSPSKCGGVGVNNVGLDYNWTGHKLAQANLYAFGRLMWDNSLTPGQIAEEWVNLTFPELEARDRALIAEILTTSRDTYRNYTVPLGIGFMNRPGHHYGPDIDGYEYDRWGTYHFADRNGIGVDRTLDTGSGFVKQYRPEVAEIFGKLENCPDDVLLFFHHVPYTHVLHSGKTVIQHIYDTHFEGVRAVENYITKWQNLEGKIPAVDFDNVLSRLKEQLENAKQWRDIVNTYFWRKSGIRDEKASADRVVFE